MDGVAKPPVPLTMASASELSVRMFEVSPDVRSVSSPAARVL